MAQVVTAEVDSNIHQQLLDPSSHIVKTALKYLLDEYCELDIQPAFVRKTAQQHTPLLARRDAAQLMIDDRLSRRVTNKVEGEAQGSNRDSLTQSTSTSYSDRSSSQHSSQPSSPSTGISSQPVVDTEADDCPNPAAVPKPELLAEQTQLRS